MRNLQKEILSNVNRSIQAWASSLSERLIEVRFYEKGEMKRVLAHYIAEALFEVFKNSITEQQQRHNDLKDRTMSLLGTKEYAQHGVELAKANEQYKQTRHAMHALATPLRDERLRRRLKALETLVCERLGKDVYEEFSEAFKQNDPPIE